MTEMKNPERVHEFLEENGPVTMTELDVAFGSACGCCRERTDDETLRAFQRLRERGDAVWTLDRRVDASNE